MRCDGQRFGSMLQVATAADKALSRLMFSMVVTGKEVVAVVAGKTGSGRTGPEL